MSPRNVIILTSAVLIALCCGCSDESNNKITQPNHPPSISGIDPARSDGVPIFFPLDTVITGQELLLTCEIDGADSDDLTFFWQADAGEFRRNDSMCVYWTAPDTAGCVHITVTVSNGLETASDSLTITVFEPQPVPPPAVGLIAPVENAVMDNGCYSQTDYITWDFTWRPVPGATRYHLHVWHVGSIYPVVDNEDLYDTSYLYNHIGYIAAGNATDWRWRVRALINGQWSEWSEERSFSAEPPNTDCAEPDPDPDPAPSPVTLLEPTPGQVLDNSCYGGADPMEWYFRWTPVEGATQYHLHVMGRTAIYPLVDNAYLTQAEYHWNGTGGYIVDGNRLGWTWKVRALVDGVWTDWAVGSFDVEPLGTDCRP